MYVTEGSTKDWSDSDAPAPAQPTLPTLYELVPRYVEAILSSTALAGLLAETGAGLGKASEVTDMIVGLATAVATETQRRLRAKPERPSTWTGTSWEEAHVHPEVAADIVRTLTGDDT